MNRLTAQVRQREQLAPSTFITLSPAQKADIKRTRIIPPQLGKSGFGRIEVTYRNPRYVVRPTL